MARPVCLKRDDHIWSALPRAHRPNEEHTNPQVTAGVPTDPPRWNLATSGAGGCQWIDRQRRADPADRAFTVLDELDVESPAETDAREEADLVDEWSGDEVAFRLAEDPLAER